jgi:hypothetical protein
MPKGVYPRRSAESRFWSKVLIGGPDECWPWTAHTVGDGYGMLRVGDERIMAHRFAWELAFGRPPDELLVCHSCDNPPCQNKRHLFLGTYQDNALDMVSKGRWAGGSPGMPGETHPCAKLTDLIVREVRRTYIPGSQTHGAKALAKAHGVSKQSMLAALKGKTWRHVG